MPLDNKIFNNLFDNPNIIPSRFLNFCMFSYDAMEAANVGGKYDADMVKVKAIIDSVDKEINDVDTNLNSQVNNTSEVKEFVYNFGQFMKDNSGAIAYALGGKTTGAFREFYPYKNEEYLTANRHTMPMLVARVAGLSKKYTDKLGTKLAGELAEFSPAYKEVLTVQRKQISIVNQDRKQRNEAFVNGQWALTGVVHSVAGINNGNPEESVKLFPFEMLYPHNGHRPKYLRGALEAGETKELLNYMLKPDVKVGIKNTSVNANIMVWLAAKPEEAAPETGVVIEASQKITVTADKLGNVNNTFLMVKNLSDINKAAYVIGVLGIKKEEGKEESEIKKIELKIAS